MDDYDSLLGQQLDEYRLDKVLGKGGMACVYQGFDLHLQRQVAIKVIDTPFQADPDYIKRFEREARAIAQLKHRQVVGVYRYGQADGLLYIAMEYIEGRDLRSELAHYRRGGQAIPLPEIGRIIDQVCLALDYIHQHGVIHRDIKPSNIMLDAEGNAYLTDFGLVLLQDDKTQGLVLGTPHYMAPEQVVSSAKAVPQSDLYAIGVILYEIFTGRLPFEAEHPHEVALMHFGQPPPPPRTLNPALSPAIEAVILKTMAKEPAQRYATGQALAEALLQTLSSPSKADQEATMPDKAHIERLIAIYQRRLQKLEERKAFQGINVDPEVAMEIEDLQQALDDLRKALDYDLTGKAIGRYPLHGLIGKGGMAEVYRGSHPGLLRNVAIKIIDDRLFKSEETGEDILERFQIEASLLASLRHDHIVQVHDFDREDHKFYLVMELIEGPTLKAKIKGYRESGQLFPLEQTLQIITGLASAVDYIHSREIIHHDLKPANVMFLSDAPEAKVILTDFGIARLIGTSGMTQMILGTPDYMAPEQFMQQREDKRTDIYALGLILYEMATNHPPFHADSPFAYMMKHTSEPAPRPTELNPQLPQAVEEVILKALAKEPGNRYESAGQLAQALREAIQPPLPPPPSREPSPQPEPAVSSPEFDYDVFISYSETDRPWVRNELLPRLERAGRRVCIDYRDFDLGAPRPTEVERAILTSQKTILVLTPAYLTSEWDAFGNLMLQAIDPAARQRRLIPLLKERCELPPRLSFLWPVNFIDPVDREMAWSQLLRAL